MLFPSAAPPTSGCSLAPAVIPRCLLISESGPDLRGGACAYLSTPGWGFLDTISAFFFCPSSGFVPGPTFLAPGPSLVVLKRKGPVDFSFLYNGGLSLNLGLVPFIVVVLLTRGFVLPVTESPSLTEPSSLPCVLLSCWSET